MLDLQHLVSSSRADVQFFGPTSRNIDTGHLVWNKPRGVSMIYMLAVGAGSAGGDGAVGAASSAAGGGGGGGGGQSTLLIPAIFLPDVLYIMTGYGVGTAHTKVSIVPQFATTFANSIVLYALFSASPGSPGSGATPGAGAPGGNAAVIASLCLAGLGRYTLLAGSPGATGGTNVPLPTNGVIVTGGAGGAALGAGVGANGNQITGTGLFPTYPGGLGATSTTSPPGQGNQGYAPILNLVYNYGGTGGGATHGTATGAGLVGGRGGDGAPGCGGGGGGGALTGSTQGIGGRGGPGFVIIIAW